MFSVYYLLCVLNILPSLITGNEIKIPVPTIVAYEPHGIKVSLSTIDGINEFFFWGNVNKELESTDLGSIRLEVFEPTDGKWVIEDNNVCLKKGDVIYYILFVKINDIMHRLDRMSYEVKEVISKPNPDTLSTTEKEPHNFRIFDNVKELLLSYSL